MCQKNPKIMASAFGYYVWYNNSVLYLYNINGYKLQKKQDKNNKNECFYY